MNPKIPHCQRCGTNIPPEEAVPYLDAFNHPIPQMYRNWCILHWSQRLGALPPNHPDFFKPIDPRTRRRDKQYLASMIGYEAVRGPSPALGIRPRLEHESKEPSLPFAPSVSNIMARARGLQSMFPGLEPLGQYLAKLTPEDWQALEEEGESQ